ncbi:MAG TPA: histone deacetylase, partial [Ottowia sp.]|nr:histone deacetylase [Ottowia sp.]
MRTFYSTSQGLALPPGHRFPMGKYAALRDRLSAECPGLRLAQAPPASDAELALAHAPAYVAAVVQGRLDARAQREIGFPWSEAMVERSRRSVGASIQATRVAQHEGVAANLAGGTHHASAEAGSGYCVFNDIAVAARLLQAERTGGGQPARLTRVAVIDLDVHQGNGTAGIFAGDASVFTLSLHGEKNFPFRKVAGDLDVGLPDGTGDQVYLDALDLALVELDSRFRPDAVFYL